MWNGFIVGWKAGNVLNATNDPVKQQRIRAKRIFYGLSYMKLKTDDPFAKKIKNEWLMFEAITAITMIGGLVLLILLWSIK